MAGMTPIQTVSRPTELDDPPTLRDAARAIPDRERGEPGGDRESAARAVQARIARCLSTGRVSGVLAFATQIPARIDRRAGQQPSPFRLVAAGSVLDRGLIANGGQRVSRASSPGGKPVAARRPVNRSRQLAPPREQRSSVPVAGQDRGQSPRTRASASRDPSNAPAGDADDTRRPEPRARSSAAARRCTRGAAAHAHAQPPRPRGPTARGHAPPSPATASPCRQTAPQRAREPPRLDHARRPRASTRPQHEARREPTPPRAPCQSSAVGAQHLPRRKRPRQLPSSGQSAAAFDIRNEMRRPSAHRPWLERPASRGCSGATVKARAGAIACDVLVADAALDSVRSRRPRSSDPATGEEIEIGPVDVDVASDVLAIDDAGPIRVPALQDPRLNPAGERRFPKQIAHDLRMLCPNVGQLPHAFWSVLKESQILCAPPAGRVKARTSCGMIDAAADIKSERRLGSTAAVLVTAVDGVEP